MKGGNVHRVLIVKTGHTEFLDSEDTSMRVSLGDVLRITPILNLYKSDEVTWLTDKYAFPLLEGNAYIRRLLHLDFFTAMQLLDEEFDTVINLEKVTEICRLVDRIHAWRKYGFRIDKRDGLVHAYDRAFEVLAVTSDSKYKKENKKTSQELLFEMVGAKWNGEDYVLGYQSRKKEIFDVGLNTLVGAKWPIKAWPDSNWDKLEERLCQHMLSVSRQDKQPKVVREDLKAYMDWLNSCRSIVTNDSLGTHLALALRKRVIGLFGPTPDQEYQLYGRGTILLPDPTPSCRPCFKRSCERGRNCMEDITVERVFEEVLRNYGAV
jgi:heptosyltransferase-2